MTPTGKRGYQAGQGCGGWDGVGLGACPGALEDGSAPAALSLLISEMGP